MHEQMGSVHPGVISLAYDPGRETIDHDNTTCFKLALDT